jgi:hypothetical protein
MQARERAPKTLWGRLKAIGVVLAALLTVLDAACGISGYSLKDLADPKNAAAVDRAARPAVRYTTQSIPLWSLPASWLAWLAFAAAWKRFGGGEQTRNENDLHDDYQRRSDVQKDVIDGLEKLNEISESRLLEYRKETTERVEHMAAALTASERDLHTTKHQVSSAERSAALMTTVSVEAFAQAEEVARRMRRHVNSDLINFVKAYMKREDDIFAIHELLTAGQEAIPLPAGKGYVQHMVYHVGTLIHHCELSILDILSLGMLPRIASEVAREEPSLSQESFETTANKKLNEELRAWILREKAQRELPSL